MQPFPPFFESYFTWCFVFGFVHRWYNTYRRWSKLSSPYAYDIPTIGSPDVLVFLAYRLELVNVFAPSLKLNHLLYQEICFEYSTFRVLRKKFFGSSPWPLKRGLKIRIFLEKQSRKKQEIIFFIVDFSTRISSPLNRRNWGSSYTTVSKKVYLLKFVSFLLTIYCSVLTREITLFSNLISNTLLPPSPGSGEQRKRRPQRIPFIRW